MSKSYFNSYLPVKEYKKLKIEAINLDITVKQHISNILKDYIKSRCTPTVALNTTQIQIEELSSTKQEK